jgi:hypothetical protein
MVWNDDSRNISQSPEAETLRGQKISYSLHELPMGIYQYQLKLSNGMQYTGKVVKE